MGGEVNCAMSTSFFDNKDTFIVFYSLSTYI